MDVLITTSDPEVFTDAALDEIRAALEAIDYVVNTITVQTRK